MPVTSGYGFRYPAYGDVPDGPGGYQNLAEDVETELNRRGLVARNERSTDVTSIPSSEPATRIMSTSGLVVAGRTYIVTGHSEVHINPTDASVPSNIAFELRFTTDGSEPLATSPILTRQIVPCVVINADTTVHMEGLYHPSTSHTLGLLMTAHGVHDGDHTYGLQAEPDFPSYIMIEDAGPQKAAVGTIY